MGRPTYEAGRVVKRDVVHARRENGFAYAWLAPLDNWYRSYRD